MGKADRMSRSRGGLLAVLLVATSLIVGNVGAAVAGSAPAAATPADLSADADGAGPAATDATATDPTATDPTAEASPSPTAQATASPTPGGAASPTPEATDSAAPEPSEPASAEAGADAAADRVPTCQPLTLTVTYNTATNAQLICSNLANEPLSYLLELRPAWGVVTDIEPSGSFRYTPNLDHIGADVFSIRVSAPGGAAVVPTIPVEVVALPVSCPEGFRARSGATFNDPSGDHDAQFAIQQQIVRLADCTQPLNPDGTRASITASFFALNYPPVRHALAAAAARGISVKVLQNSHADKYTQWQVLAKQLGADITAGNFAVTCPNGCLTPRTPPPAGYPRAVFWVSPESTTGRAFTFSDRTRPASSPIVAWYWDFGDGWTKLGRGPHTHKYARDGQFTAKLIVRAADGRRHTATNKVNVPDLTEAGAPGLHSKLFLFSNVGVGANQVTKVFLHSSSNPTYRQSTVGFNNAYTSVGDPYMFAALSKYLGDLLKGATGELMTASYYHSVPSNGSSTSPPQRAYFYPRPNTTGASSIDSDNIRQLLRQVQCTYQQNGVTKRTYVTLSMAIFTRRGVAEDLWRMAYDRPSKWGGCVVEVLYSSMSQRVKDTRTGLYTTSTWGVADCLATNPVTSSGRYNTLDSRYGRCGGGTLNGWSPQSAGAGPFWWNKTSRLSGGRLTVGVSCPVSARVDSQGRTVVRCISSTTNTHNKVVLINGMFAGQAQKVVVTGSPNLTTGALRANDEVMFRINSGTAYDQYRADYATLRARAIAQSTNSVTVNGRSTRPDTYEPERDPVTGQLLPQIQPGIPVDVLTDAD